MPWTKRAIRHIVEKELTKNTELKHQFGRAHTSVGSQGLFFCPSDIGVGTADNQRVGDEIMPIYLKLNLAYYVADTSNLTRITVFRYIPDTANATLVDIDVFYEPADVAAGLAPQAMYNHDIRDNFEVLYDANSPVLNAESQYGWKHEIHIPFAKKRVQFTDTGGTLPVNQGSNHILVLFSSDSTASTHPQLHFTYDFAYTDL